MDLVYHQDGLLSYFDYYCLVREERYSKILLYPKVGVIFLKLRNGLEGSFLLYENYKIILVIILYEIYTIAISIPLRKGI